MPLHLHEVKIARHKEIQYLWDRNVYEYAPGAEARAQTGRNPVDLKWIDTNKSTTVSPRHRSRLVCTEVHHKGVEQVFQEDVPQVADPLLISIADVCRAHFNADAVRNVYVRLPEEDSKSKEVGICGKLRKTMCGTLNAAQRWREHSAQVFEGGGFSRGLASPCHCFHKDLQTLYTVTIVSSLADRRHVNTHWIFCRRSTS